MSTYTKTDYVVPFDSIDANVNLYKIVHSLVDNVPQLSIHDEMKPNENGSFPSTFGNWYWANLKYSGYSNFLLGFRTIRDVDAIGAVCFRLIIRIYASDVGSPDKYNTYYRVYEPADTYLKDQDSTTVDMLFLDETDNSFKYTLMTFDDAIHISFTGINSASGIKKQDLGVVFISPLVDYFTSERLAGVLYQPPKQEYGCGLSSSAWLAMHNGNANRAYTGQYVVIGGTTYYAGTNSVASPIAFRSGDYSLIPFYGFINNSAFLYQIRVGSDSNYLTYAPGSKVELGGCTFVSVGMGLGLFARIS